MPPSRRTSTPSPHLRQASPPPSDPVPGWPLRMSRSWPATTMKHSRYSSREQVLKANLPSIARVCERFITRLGERSELLPVSRVKRPARRALERLSAHTEDWATRTLSGPVPRRALAVTREEDADLYENRMVTELVHPILTSALSDRIRRLRRLTSDLADLARAEDEGTHYRRYRLYTFWGADAARAAESSSQASQTLRELEKLAAWVQSLRGSTLTVALRGRRTGQRSLRNTNVIANDRHYRAAGLVWSAYEREPEADETAEERQARFLSRHRAFDNYVLGLVVRSLDDLGYAPGEDEMPAGNSPVALHGPWGEVTFTRTPAGVIVLTSHGQQHPPHSPARRGGPGRRSGGGRRLGGDRWPVRSRIPRSSCTWRRAGPFGNCRLSLATSMMSAGLTLRIAVRSWRVFPSRRLRRPAWSGWREQSPSLCEPGADGLSGAGAVAWRPSTEAADRSPHQLDLTQPGHSSLFHRAETGITVRRPLTTTERSKLEAAIRYSRTGRSRPGGSGNSSQKSTRWVARSRSGSIRWQGC